MLSITAPLGAATPRIAALFAALVMLGGCASLQSAVAPKPASASGIATASTQPLGPSSGVAGWNGDISAPGLTASHRTLPLGSTVRVTNLQTGQNATVTVTSRVVGAKDRDIDLSRDAAAQIGALQNGVATVLIEPISLAPTIAYAPVAAPGAVYVLPSPTAPAASTPSSIATSSTAASAPPAYDPNLSTASIPLNVVTGGVSSPARAGLSGARYLQIGSFRDPANARRAVERLSREGLVNGAYGPASVTPVVVGGVVHHRVRVGPIPNAELAAMALADAQARGHGGARIMTP